MSRKIVVSGCTGNLGTRIVKSFVIRDATVIALFRQGSKPEKIESLKALGAVVELIDPSNIDQIALACHGADWIVSAMAGLRDVIVGTQKRLLEAAIKARVPRIIPSDF